MNNFLSSFKLLFIRIINFGNLIMHCLVAFVITWNIKTYRLPVTSDFDLRVSAYSLRGWTQFSQTLSHAAVSLNLVLKVKTTGPRIAGQDLAYVQLGDEGNVTMVTSNGSVIVTTAPARWVVMKVITIGSNLISTTWIVLIN